MAKSSVTELSIFLNPPTEKYASLLNIILFPIEVTPLPKSEVTFTIPKVIHQSMPCIQEKKEAVLTAVIPVTNPASGLNAFTSSLTQKGFTTQSASVKKMKSPEATLAI